VKYFTPDLLLRFGSPDPKIADDAHAEWEKKHAAYGAHLKAIRDRLPKAVRSLLRLCLHDARMVLEGGASDHRSFLITLQLAGSRDKFVQVNYKLAAEPKINFHRELVEGPTPLEWLYDELDLLSQQGQFPVFRHSILLTNGIELELVFHELGVKTYEKVLSTVDSSSQDGAGRLQEIVS